MLSRSNYVKSLINKYCNKTAFGSSRGTGDKSFQELSDSSKKEIISAINSLKASFTNSKKVNDRRKKLFSLMSWRQQKISKEVGYTNKISRIDTCLRENQSLLDAIANYGIEKYGLDYRDFSNASSGTNASSSNYRVIESLEHYLRDWDSKSCELEPILSYVKKYLEKIIPDSELANTRIIFPGSGLGRIAHEIAKSRNYEKVYAVEYSGLMHLFNDFIYNNTNSFSLYPYVYSCSNFTSVEYQFRNTIFRENIEKPQNLELVHQDFREFELGKSSTETNVILVTAFFMDTAENMLDYMDSIKTLASKTKDNNVNGYWINVGPLKYGTAARVEFNAEELSKIRQKYGWFDIDYTNTIANKESIGDNGLVGYITDTKSMWQGFYGLDMWVSSRKENTTKPCNKNL